MNPYDHRESFDRVNKDWEYAIDAGPRLMPNPAARFLVWFDYQPGANKWLAGCGGKEFRLMQPETVVQLLNEALQAGLLVIAVKRNTGDAFYFLNPTPENQNEEL